MFHTRWRWEVWATRVADTATYAATKIIRLGGKRNKLNAVVNSIVPRDVSYKDDIKLDDTMCRRVLAKVGLSPVCLSASAHDAVPKPRQSRQSDGGPQSLARVCVRVSS